MAKEDKVKLSPYVIQANKALVAKGEAAKSKRAAADYGIETKRQARLRADLESTQPAIAKSARVQLAASQREFDKLPTVAEADLLGTPTTTPAQAIPAVAPQAIPALAPQAVPQQAVAISPERAKATQTLNSLLEANIADNPDTYAPRQAIERLDTSDLDAMRESMQVTAERTGRPVPAGSLAVIDRIEQARRAEARQGISTNDRYRMDSRNAARQERATDALIGQQQNTISNRNLTDLDKLEYNNAATVLADPMMRDTPQYRAADAYMARREQSGMRERLLELLARDTEQLAEGGEVGMDTEYMGEMPQAIAPPVDMDSGDYVIPVEAMRFYGRKFFMDLISKAEDTE